MLHYSAVYPATLALLKDLMALPSLPELDLVGGTALALQIGHRISVDLDLFGETLPDKHAFLAELDEDARPLADQNYFFAFEIRGVKVDVLRFPYSLIRPIVEVEGIRLVSMEDIAAMKMIAVANRGSKKDFFDIANLLHRFTLKEIMGFYEEKTKSEPPFYILKCLCYFDDAESDLEPEILNDMTWEQVKSELVEAVEAFYLQ